MFDLETAITDWKQSLTARESLSVDNVAELETHLRDAVSTLASGSLNEEEAFLIAQRRVGPSGELGSEFAKDNPSHVWVLRLKWICVGVLLYLAHDRVIFSQFSSMFLRLVPRDGSGVSFVLVYATVSTLYFAFILVLGVLLTIRHAPWIEWVSSRILRVPTSVLLGLPVALITLPPLIGLLWTLLFDFSGNARNALNAVILVYSLMSPGLLVAAIYVLHRREHASETAHETARPD